MDSCLSCNRQSQTHVVKECGNRHFSHADLEDRVRQKPWTRRVARVAGHAAVRTKLLPYVRSFTCSAVVLEGTRGSLRDLLTDNLIATGEGCGVTPSLQRMRRACVATGVATPPERPFSRRHHDGWRRQAPRPPTQTPRSGTRRSTPRTRARTTFACRA